MQWGTIFRLDPRPCLGSWWQREIGNPSTEIEQADTNANGRTRSPLAGLVLSSTPDEEPYELLALGQVGSAKLLVLRNIRS